MQWTAGFRFSPIPGVLAPPPLTRDVMLPMWRLVSIDWWLWLVLGLLLIVAGLWMLLYPDNWVAALGFTDRVVVREFSFCMILIGAVCWFAAEAKPRQ